MQYGCVGSHFVDVGITYSDGIMTRCVKSSVRKGAGLSHTEGPLKGSIMDDELQIFSGSEFVLEDAEGSMEDSVSLVEESYADVGVFASNGDDAAIADDDSTKDSGKGKSQKRMRQPIMEGDGFLFYKDGRGVRGIIPMSVRGRCILDKICKFNKMLELYQREAIEETILKPTSEH
ncbi:hypothetical protein Cgig2_000334 [Carnegiea gigantea]|uniref:Uncharacterized protein n=1 Tax=Carnegiea gigantea TaxID=171969 RepID=A0A9Q1GN55_9CARY|nr:hypothetical protein Cgig2_000334 [Carnegiea gigantea]